LCRRGNCREGESRGSSQQGELHRVPPFRIECSSVSEGTGLARAGSGTSSPVAADALAPAPFDALRCVENFCHGTTPRQSFAPNWVFGLEADFQGTTQKDSTCNFACEIFITQKLDWFGTGRARLGYTNGDWMYCVTGGGA
jgi:hypothetical protein